MCEFFSFVSKGDGFRFYYFDDAMRKRIADGDKTKVHNHSMRGFEPDSHASICKYFGLNEDDVNKYEYDLITGEFSVDMIGAPDNDDGDVMDDRVDAEKWVRNLDFKKVYEHLKLHKIEKPFVGNKHVPTEYDLKLFGKAIKAIRTTPTSRSFEDELEENISSKVGERMYESMCTSIASLNEYIADDGSYNQTVASLVADQLDLQYTVDPKPFAKLWNRGLIFRIVDDYWNGHGPEYQLVSGNKRAIVHRRAIVQ